MVLAQKTSKAGKVFYRVRKPSGKDAKGDMQFQTLNSLVAFPSKANPKNIVVWAETASL